MKEYLDDKFVFLAGGTGLVGSALLKHLLQGYPKTRIRATYLSTEPFIQNGRIEYVRADLRSYDQCRDALRGCDIVVMAAAFTGGARLTASQPWRHVKDNVTMNMNLLEAFCETGIKRALYIGSATLYQPFEGLIAEDALDMNKDPHMAHMGFGWGVRAIEGLCRMCHERYGVEMIIVRASNIFGPFARFSPEDSNFIPALIRKAVERMDPFEVWGRADVSRDVIYADDFARGIVMALRRDNVKFGIFNMGSGVKTTVVDIVKWALKYAGYRPREIRYVAGDTQKGGCRILDCAKAWKVLGWEPECSIEEGVKKTLEWWIQNKGSWPR